MKNLLLSSASIAILLGSAMPASAEQMSMADMQKHLMQLSAQVENLSSMVKGQSETITAQKSQIEAQSAQLANISPAAGNTNNGVKITMGSTPKISSADGNYSFQPFGRVHLDATAFIDDKKDHPSNANFRRARLGFKGNLGKDFKYKTEIEYAKESIDFKEVSLTYTGLDSTDLSIGNIKPPLGLDNSTSSNYIQFLERSTINNAFARGEILGFSATTGGDNWSLKGGVYNEDAGNTSTTDDEDISFDLRGSTNLLGSDSDNVLHFGLGSSYRKPTGDINFDVKVTGIGDDLVDTGTIAGVNNVQVYGAEFAGVFGPINFQSEYMRTYVDRDNASDAEFDGYYAQASYFLTGETRPYSAKTGKFGRIKPTSPFDLDTNDWGAWEIAARYGNLDLNDAGAGITGGEIDTYTLGLNWYLSNNIRFMADYVSVNTDDSATTANDDPQVVNVRAQWDF